MREHTPEGGVPLQERLRALRRHRRTLLIIVASGLVATVVLAAAWPPTYRATATILIEQQEIPQDVVRSTISSFADQRIQIISQRVMTSQNLIGIVERYNLYPWQRRTRAREVVIERMRDDIKMRLISANVMDPRSGRPMQATIAFTVAYESGSPDVALKVANELTSLYLNENVSSRTQVAQQTESFLNEEADRLARENQALAEKLAAFKEKHVTALPELAQANFQLLDRTELDLRDARNRIGSLDAQKVLLQAQLAQMSPTSQMFSETGQRILSPEDRLKTLKADLASLRARYGPDHPDVRKAEREVAGLQTEVSSDNGVNDLLRQLEDDQARLAAARQRYSAGHPDVVTLERAVASLQQQIRDAPAAERVREARRNPDNPAFIQVKAQLDAVLAERAEMERKIVSLDSRLDDLQKRMSQAPDVEKEYRALLKDYEGAQLKYQEVRSKQMEAQLSQNLETERKGERFTLIEPPLPPEEPVSPNRSVVLILGALATAAVALLVVGVRDALDQSIRGARDLGRLIEVPPLAAIPLLETSEEAAARRRVARYSWQGALGALAVAVVLVHFLYRPIDVIWLTVARRLGL